MLAASLPPSSPPPSPSALSPSPPTPSQRPAPSTHAADPTDIATSRKQQTRDTVDANSYDMPGSKMPRSKVTQLSGPPPTVRI
eukprot:753263-Rhodomonas_salina.1